MLSKKQLYEMEEKLTKKMSLLENEVIEIYGIERGKRGLSGNNKLSLHGVVFGKNNNYIDLSKIQFKDFNDFLNKWLIGLDKFSIEHDYKQKKYNPGKEQKLLTIDLLKYPNVKEYIFLGLERNFYREYNERTRFKPNDNLWEIWFGDNNMLRGLFITPVFRSKKYGEAEVWMNDISEIRRANFEYYTIGHLLNSGLINPDNGKLKTFKDTDDIIDFYSNTLRKSSKSNYEKQIIDRYIEFLKTSKDINNQLLLIPEFRYLGLEKKHEYRLDFTILNPFTKKLVGFEISPKSSHLSVSGIKSKTQKEVNEEISKQWEKEIGKRNNFFNKYDISIITFTDSDLCDIDQCFNQILKYLQFDKQENINIEQRLKNILK